MISILQILRQGCLQRTSTQSIPIHRFNCDCTYIQTKYFPGFKSERMCLSGCVHDQGLKGHFRTCTGIKSTGSHDRSQGRIGCGILFPENVNYQRGAMKTSKYTCITPPPFPEELKKFLSRPRSPAAQSIIRTSSSVQAGLGAH